jgi:hypothetical protein
MKMTDAELILKLRHAASIWFAKDNILLLEEALRRWKMAQLMAAMPAHAVETNIPDEDQS